MNVATRQTVLGQPRLSIPEPYAPIPALILPRIETRQSAIDLNIHITYMIFKAVRGDHTCCFPEPFQIKWDYPRASVGENHIGRQAK
jgi:hypothetical protein